jgi:hypothetical protein
MWEEEVWGWVDTSVPNYSQGIKPAYNQGRIIRLKYYAAVHGKLGPVLDQVLHRHLRHASATEMATTTR